MEIEKGKKGKKTISESYKFIYRVYNSRCRMKSWKLAKQRYFITIRWNVGAKKISIKLLLLHFHAYSNDVEEILKLFNK